jgi:hypothetical protein
MTVDVRVHTKGTNWANRLVGDPVDVFKQMEWTSDTLRMGSTFVSLDAIDRIEIKVLK